MAEEEDPVDEAVVGQVTEIWEWDHQPTLDEVKKALVTLPNVWGVKAVDFVEFIQPLSQKKNISETREKQYVTRWNLYMLVAGRVAMITQAAEINDWAVSFEPETIVPNGMGAGFLAFDSPDAEYGRIVYREYCSIASIHAEAKSFLGRKSGTAMVGSGSSIAGGKLVEKLETAARGRSIAAWGFGVLPGSGVASLEEVRDAERGDRPNRRAPAPSGPKLTRSEVEEQLRQVLTAYEQTTGLSEAEIDAKVVRFVSKTFNKEVKRAPDPDVPEEMGPWDFSPLKDGEVVLLRNRIKQQEEAARREKSEL